MQVYGISCTGISILGSSAGGSYRTSEHYFGPTCRTPWSCWQFLIAPSMPSSIPHAASGSIAAVARNVAPVAVGSRSVPS